MPKSEIDYSNTIIYKITCKNHQVTDVYVGHTTNFVQRKHLHKICCINNTSPIYNCKLYEVIRKNGGWSNWKMEIITVVNCSNHDEAIQKEEEYFNILNATLNINKPTLKSNIKNINIETNTETKINNCFNCAKCNFNSYKLSDYKRHLLTEKHKQFNIQQVNIQHVNNIKIFTCKCGKDYTFASGLSKHKKLCKQKDISVELLLDIINKDNEIKDFLLEQNKQVIDKLTEQNNKLIEQNNKLIQIAENNKPNIISNNNNTINTTNFNLNVFLNETCKDALNITDFVESLVLKVNDLEETARLGYTNGISKIFINGLKKLDICKRPLHCSDLKRNTLYIKEDNQWTKENDDKPTLTKAIKKVSNKNIQNIFEWQKLNPCYNDSTSKQNDKYNKLICETMSGSTKEEQLTNYDKIIKNVIKEVIIDKE